MADQKPLNPNASPYHLLHHHHHHLIPPSNTIRFYQFYVYVVPRPWISSTFLPLPYNSLLLKPQKMVNPAPPAVVPSGPELRKTKKMIIKWRPKPAGFNEQGKIRWKNNREEYHKVLPLEPNTTSLMIKNIPNKYTRKLLIQTLDAHCAAENNQLKKKNTGTADDQGVLSAYDFLYLPIDFKRRLNAGFAFVNFTNAEAALRFREAFNGKRWGIFGGSKVAEISRARVQGKKAMIENCKNIDFSYGSEEDMPVWFEPARDGSVDVRGRMVTVGRCP